MQTRLNNLKYKNMKLITNSDDLNEFCHGLKDQKFVTVDFEFLREKTYYAELCLIQVGSLAECAIIDPLAADIDMSSFFELMQDENVIKVFHSGRQDIEILYNLTGKIPTPLFDTQVAGMACGFGEAVSYENLVKIILGISLDKSNRLSDWSRRPLSERQLEYAISDVTHLVPIFEYLLNKLIETNRGEWLDEEMQILNNPATYFTNPIDAWQRIKHRTTNPLNLTVLRELAAWREKRAQRKDVPRQSFIKDDGLVAIMLLNPKNMDELSSIRTLRKDVVSGKLGAEILETLSGVSEIAEENYVVPPKENRSFYGSSSLFELLKLLLKVKSQEEGVVSRMIACDDDLRSFAMKKDKNNPILQGWRLKIFGEDAIALRAGKLFLGFNVETNKIEFQKIERVEEPQD